jgi:flagellar motor switch protein FliG
VPPQAIPTSDEAATALAPALPGVRKSAILLLSLEPNHAREILSRLPSDAVRSVQREMASLQEIESSERTQVFQQYRHALEHHEARQLARAPVVRPALPLVASVLPAPAPDPLYDCTPHAIYEALLDEHPQLIAAVLASLPVQKAGQCLGRLPIRMQIEVIRRLASMRSIDPTLLDEVYTAIRSRPRAPVRVAAPCALLAQVLDDADETPHPAPALISPASSTQDPDASKFEDLLGLDDRAIRLVLEEIDSEGVGLAISTVSRRLRRRVLSALSKSLVADVKRAAAARPLYLSEIESAQARILRVVQRLEAAGDLQLPRSSPTSAAHESTGAAASTGASAPGRGD